MELQIGYPLKPSVAPVCRSAHAIPVNESIDRSIDLETVRLFCSRSRTRVAIPKACVHERDLCDFYFVANRRMHKAIFEDILDEGISKHAHGEGERQSVTGPPDQFQEQGELGRINGFGDGEEAGLGVPPRSSGHMNGRMEPRGPRGIHHPGAAMKAFIEDSFSDLTRPVAMIEE